MNVPRIAARRLMRWTTRRPPAGRAEWALAMQREYDSLDGRESGGELGWALGCAFAMAGWKLRENWLYLALLLATPPLLYGLNMLQFELLRIGLVSRDAYVAFFRSYGTLYGLLIPALPLAAVLGAYRPNKVATTVVLGCLMVQHVGGTLITMAMLGGSFLSWWGPNATLYMAPPLIGLSASLGIWYFGAAAGARWARRRMPE
jgi:hypothetical protein